MKQYCVRESEEEWVLHCPATGWIRIPRDGRWTFNGDYEKPTFSPSFNETWGSEGQSFEEFKSGPPSGRNHCFIRDGHIQYLADCTHSLKGQTVPVPPLTESEMAMYWPEVR